jgi:hypothetical protein
MVGDSEVVQLGIVRISPGMSGNRNVWSAAELQAKNKEWQLV